VARFSRFAQCPSSLLPWMYFPRCVLQRQNAHGSAHRIFAAPSPSVQYASSFPAPAAPFGVTAARRAYPRSAARAASFMRSGYADVDDDGNGYDLTAVGGLVDGGDERELTIPGHDQKRLRHGPDAVRQGQRDVDRAGPVDGGPAGPKHHADAPPTEPVPPRPGDHSPAFLTPYSACDWVKPSYFSCPMSDLREKPP